MFAVVTACTVVRSMFLRVARQRQGHERLTGHPPPVFFYRVLDPSAGILARCPFELRSYFEILLPWRPGDSNVFIIRGELRSYLALSINQIVLATCPVRDTQDRRKTRNFLPVTCEHCKTGIYEKLADSLDSFLTINYSPSTHSNRFSLSIVSFQRNVLDVENQFDNC